MYSRCVYFIKKELVPSLVEVMVSLLVSDNVVVSCVVVELSSADVFVSSAAMVSSKS